jgi:hypothetical protein
MFEISDWAPDQAKLELRIIVKTGLAATPSRRKPHANLLFKVLVAKYLACA